MRNSIRLMMPRQPARFAGLFAAAFASLWLAACGSDNPPTTTTGTPGPVSFAHNPCIGGDSVNLAVAQAALIDCSNGGTTVTFPGNGASYMVVAQLPTESVANQFIPYSIASGSLASASLTAQRVAAERQAAAAGAAALPRAPALRLRPMAAQRQFTAAVRHWAQTQFVSGAFRHLQNGGAALFGASGVSASFQPPPLGSTRTFHVLSGFFNSSPTFSTVTATLVYSGANVLMYLDNASPANGFTSPELNAFGVLFDQTLYGIDSTAFGPPTDVDQNGHVIMLMSPVVNAEVTSDECLNSGYIAGFFDSEDFAGASDPNSNQGEIFYSIVPDPTGTVSCSHTITDVGLDVPATFLHEMQHLIDYSQHVIVRGLDPPASWMDEGLSIVAEELGSVYYEQKCPPPSCRSSSAQIFPDSSQGFVIGFLNDSYDYAFLPDTASVTLHDDSESGFSWRGGDWLMMRWLGDQFGIGVYRKLEDGPADGFDDIGAAAGQSFTSLFSNFGMALYADSFPGLPRTTAPAVNRFVSRNVKQLWARWYATEGPSSDVPTATPLYLYPITTDTTSGILSAGAMSFYRLDTPASSASVTIRFSAPGGSPLPGILHPQLAIFRLPAGQ